MVSLWWPTAFLALAACQAAAPTPLPEHPKSPFTGYTSPRYSDPKAWFCWPGRSGDPCARDLSTTELRADGSRTVVPRAVAPDPGIDCFYVYPTVDLGLLPGNHDDFADVGAVGTATFAQAAQLGQVCRLYVPLYRQVTIGTYLHGGDRLAQGLDVAFSDVADAFLHYMGHENHGRKLVLVGHSQGAEMVKRLLQRYFDDDPLMRSRLLLALPIGGNLEVVSGQTTGGTFQKLPICTRPDELGCVIGYRSFRPGSAGRPPEQIPEISDREEEVCVNPASVGDPTASVPLHAVYPVSKRLQGIAGVTTPFVSYPDLYRGRCVIGPQGGRFLEVTETPSPARRSPIDLGAARWGTPLGTHIIDFQVAEDDLVDLVRQRARR